MNWTARIIVLLSLAVVSVLCLTADEIEAERSGWSVAPNTQYHIQTDEGPERYFRFQTLNGQFRKEKRLEDGTVIGTEGWLDPLGYLRIKDYIADREGFRILKSKMVFVGKDRGIEDAVATSKRVPAQSGVLAKPRRPPNPFRQPSLQDLSGNSIESNTVKPYRLYQPVTRRYHVPSSTPRAFYSSTVDPRPILLENDYSKPSNNYLHPVNRPQETAYRSSYPILGKPALVMEPPIFVENVAKSSQPLAVQVSPESSYGLYRHDRRAAPLSESPVNSPAPRNATGRRHYRGSSRYYAPASSFSQNSRFSSPSASSLSQNSGFSSPSASSLSQNSGFSSPSASSLSQNSGFSSPSASSLSQNSGFSSPSASSLSQNSASSSRTSGSSVRARSPVYASDRSDPPERRRASGGQDYEFPPYDGHHTTADGFQYYLNTHYHEEERKKDSDKSIGSFGYVDPFGIRRVVYYKSDPQNGFVHKKNNRYVGFDATPYDPLPPDSQ